MRKYHQKLILNLIHTIRDAQSGGLFADAKAGALAICNFIRKLECEKTGIAALLLEYCELLSKVDNGELGKELLEPHLLKVEDSIRQELKPDKIEIVFFPYQLSMFDSFESIYLAAREDPSCDVFCVPIPWYERNSDGTLGAMHYDGGQYPAYVDIMDWRKYNIESRHPDVVFVHNPFDAANYVSTVHPVFYGERLKKHTDLLCYIAYYLPTNPDGSCGLSTAASTVSYPADLFIAQSEAEKQKYLRVNPNVNVVALGSPKLDRVIKASQSHCLPKAWILRIPSIECKKIILLNSSLAYLLQYGEVYLDRLFEYITAILSKPQFVLLWRPHPLMLPTLKSMRPALMNQYHELMELVSASSLAMVDDSESFLDAVLASAAYVGENDSSIARIYTITGKPMYTMVIKRVPHRTERAGGEFVYDYPETEEFSISVFLDQLLSGEIPSFNEQQVNLQKTIYPNSDGTAGTHIYQYVKGITEVK